MFLMNIFFETCFILISWNIKIVLSLKQSMSKGQRWMTVDNLFSCL